jgi:hypothetical protein
MGDKCKMGGGVIVGVGRAIVCEGIGGSLVGVVVTTIVVRT